MTPLCMLCETYLGNCLSPMPPLCMLSKTNLGELVLPDATLVCTNLGELLLLDSTLVHISNAVQHLHEHQVNLKERREANLTERRGEKLDLTDVYNLLPMPPLTHTHTHSHTHLLQIL